LGKLFIFHIQLDALYIFNIYDERIIISKSLFSHRLG